MSDLPHDLILSVAKLTVILFLASAASLLIKRPAVRAACWAAVFAILPIAILATHGRSVIELLPAQSQVAEVEVMRIEVLTVPSAEQLGQQASVEKSTAVPTSNYASSALIWIFLSGLVVAILPLFISLIRLGFIRKQRAPVHLAGALARIEGNKLGHTPLYLSSHPSAPCVIGIFRPSILLPETACDWTRRRLTSTLLHEAAHICRKDPVYRFMASLVRAMFWFHPLIWYAYRQLVLAQEQACDEAAIEAGVEPSDYAEDLLCSVNFDARSPQHSLGMARWSQLGSRIHTILTKPNNNKSKDMKKTKLLITGVTAMTFALSSIGYSEDPEAPEREDADGPDVEVKVEVVAGQPMAGCMPMFGLMQMAGGVIPKVDVQLLGAEALTELERGLGVKSVTKAYMMVGDGEGGYIMKEVPFDGEAIEAGVGLTPEIMKLMGEAGCKDMDKKAFAKALKKLELKIAEDIEKEIEGAE